MDAAAAAAAAAAATPPLPAPTERAGEGAAAAEPSVSIVKCGRLALLRLGVATLVESPMLYSIDQEVWIVSILFQQNLGRSRSVAELTERKTTRILCCVFR